MNAIVNPYFGIPEISLRQLKSALLVAQHRNVTRAASKLNRSQTAITKAISDLESLLGVALFDRTSTGMMPTVYGEAVAKRVSRVVAEFEQAGIAYKQYQNSHSLERPNPIFSMDISYKRLAALVALYQKREVVSAARSLGVTKAAVYNSVRQLEELLDSALFERQPQGVSPTPYCHLLVRHTKLAFAQIRHAIDDIASINGVTQGRLVIGTLPYTRTVLTPKAINQLLQDHPQLDVATQEGPYDVLEAGLRSGDIDLIVGATRPQDEGADVRTEVLFEDRLAVIARSGHPLMTRKTTRLEDLQGAHWVLPAAETPSRQLFDETLAQHGIQQPEQAVQTSSLSMVRGLLVDSDRIALLSEHQVYYDKLYGILDVVPVELEDTYRPIGITLRAHTQPSPAAQLFLDGLRQVAKDMRTA